jgi:hypothetical protein
MPKISKTKKGISAWLVTWENSGSQLSVPLIAAIFNSRWSSERVRQIVEVLYINSSYSLSERIRYAKDKSSNPYPAEFNKRQAGVPFSGHIICGHNPYLFARLVDNLVYDGDEFEDNERLVTWDDRVVPENKLF